MFNRRLSNHRSRSFAQLRAALWALVWTFASCLTLSISISAYAQADQIRQPGAVQSPFAVPAALRARVNFWKDIFTKYGRAHLVFHHREYPQVVFMVLDLTSDYEQMNPVAFSKFKDAVERKNVADLKDVFRSLANGNSPRTIQERMIAQKMSAIRGGAEKYRRILDEDLLRTQTGIKERFAESIARANSYLPAIEKIFVEEYGLPREVTRLPFIESSFDYSAYSSVGAAGIWQFMPRTGKLYMQVGKLIDERRDPIIASRAAARYLSDAYNRLGSWPLALTSYNHGVAGVASKVRKFGTDDISELIENPDIQAFGFASSNFYPEFLAALEVHDNYKRYFPSLMLNPPIQVREMRLDRSVSVSYLTSQLGVDQETLEQCNYALTKMVWSGRAKIPAGYVLKIPVNYSARASNLRIPETPENVQPSAPPSSSIYGGLVYKVRRKDTLLSIAKRFDTNVKDLRRLNGLKSNEISEGQTLTVKEPERNSAPERSRVAVQQKVVQQKPQPTPSTKKSKTTTSKTQSNFVAYKVKNGDTLSSIAKKFNVDAKQISKVNRIGSKLSVGQKLNIPTQQVSEF